MVFIRIYVIDKLVRASDSVSLRRAYKAISCLSISVARKIAAVTIERV